MKNKILNILKNNPGIPLDLMGKCVCEDSFILSNILYEMINKGEVHALVFNYPDHATKYILFPANHKPILRWFGELEALVGKKDQKQMD